MALAFTLIKTAKQNRVLKIYGTLVFSGSYPAGGEPLDLASYNRLISSKQPDFVHIEGKAGFEYQYDAANKKIIVYANTAGGADAPMGVHSTGAYAAGVTGDTPALVAEWAA
jgi:hypothetical protein